ncbi:MAG: hypothetical protein O2955_15005, partial [Planctomycetota bacterium]|nr:hypothetical protein [Planctomycetota bacterium]
MYSPSRRFPRTDIFIVIFSLFALLVPSPSRTAVFSQDKAAETPKVEVPPTNPVEQFTVADLEARIKQVEESTDLDAEANKKITDPLRSAIGQIQRMEMLRKQADEFQAAVNEVQERVKSIRADIESLKTQEPEKPDNLPLPELEQLLATKNLLLQDQKSTQAQLESEPAKRAGRRKELRENLMKIPSQLEEIKQKLKVPPPENEPALVTQAQQADLLTRRRLLELESVVGQHEFTKYDSEDAADLNSFRRDRQVLQIKKTQAEIDLIKSAVQQKREIETQVAVARAQKEMIGALPALKPYFEENERLAQEAKTLNELNLKTEANRQQAQQRLEKLREQIAQTKRKVDAVGLTGSVGLLLRKERNELPNVSRAEQSIAARRQIIDDTQFASLEYNDRKNDLTDLDPHIEKILASVDLSGDDAEQSLLKDETQKFLESQRTNLDLLLRNYDVYFKSLLELDTTEQELVSLATEYRTYIDERVLWIRSAKPLYADFELDQADLKWLQLRSWKNLAHFMLADVVSAPVIYLSALLMFGALLHVGRQLRRDLTDLAKSAERSSCIVFLPTVQAMILTLVISLPAPGLLFFLSWRLKAISDQDQLVQGLSSGFFVISVIYVLNEIVRQMCRPRGLAESHFDWPTSVCVDIHKSLPNLPHEFRTLGSKIMMIIF